MRFKQFFQEAFRKSKKVTHLFDVPMFSIYLDNELNIKTLNPEEIHAVKNACAEARKQIGKMGFNSMHANVVLKNITEPNWITRGKMGGYALRKGKYMEIELNYLKNPEHFVYVLVHEWAHLWMFNNSKQFKKAVADFYKSKLNQFKQDANVDDIIHKTELPREKEKTLLDFWQNRFGDLVKIDSPIQTYVRRRIILSPQNLSQYPIFMPIGVHTKQSFTAKALSSGYREVEIGDEIKIEKLYGKWGLQVYDGNTRYEFLVEENEIFDYVDEKEFFEKANEMNQKIRERNKGGFANPTMSDIVKFINSTFKDSMKNALYHHLTSRHMNEEMQQFCQTTTDFWIKECIIPIIKKYLKNPKTFYKNVLNKPKYSSFNNNSIEDPYDILWVENPFKKAKNASFIESMQTLWKMANKEEQRKEFDKSSNLNGPEKNPLRDLVNSMKHIWHSSYGMANDDEIWATAVDSFFQLPLNDRKSIIDLIVKNR